ncbi:ent-kaurene oxidase [Xylariales sp. AK1849]|nr:ent-kaurene oxidase [Xylariales sp. AK1849]
MDRLSTMFSERGQPLIPIAVTLLGVFIISRLSGSSYTHPLIGKEYGNSEQRRKAFLAGAAHLYSQGYRTFKDQAFRLTTVDGDRIIVPHSALEELRQLPDDYISNRRALNKFVESRYTGLSGESNFLNHVVRSDLTRSLSRITPRLAAEVTRTVDEVLGPCEEWTAVAIYQKLLHMVAIISGHIFLGPELCRREEYLHASINYTVDLFIAVRKLKEWNPWLRAIGQYFTPELKKVAEHRRKAKDFLLPIIRDRKAAMKKGEEMPDDMLQWMINKAEAQHVTDEGLAEVQLTLSLAAIHTTTMTAMDILCELVIRPEIVDELRNEVNHVLEENNGVMTTHALFEMKLLDSVMREAQRVNPFNQGRFARYVNKPITLSSGLHIQAGVTIEAAHGAVIQNAELYPDPKRFDARRFVELRTSDKPDPIKYKNREQYQFIAVTKENMSFGYGAHACPGRFFAANEIKLIMARILLQYDMRLPDGAKELLPHIVQGSVSQPNPRIQIELRKAKAQV